MCSTYTWVSGVLVAMVEARVQMQLLVGVVGCVLHTLGFLVF